MISNRILADASKKKGAVLNNFHYLGQPLALS